jgi:PTH1 family peptidyl-tRNA hydrolase
MSWIIVGLGNPGEEYEHTRHNTGRMITVSIADSFDASEWKVDKKLSADVAKGDIGGKPVKFVLPNTFMNLSGKAVKPLIGSVKAAERLIVIYDDMDLPFGSMKISFGRSSGGHNGLESIIKALKTKDFVRIRIGVAPTTPGGKLKKPSGEDAVIKFILGTFKKPEVDELKKITKRAKEAVEIIVTESKEKAMSVMH